MGTRGADEVQRCGGTVVVQEPATAKFDGMPRSAVAAGLAQHIMPAHQISSLLAEWAWGNHREHPVPSKVEPLRGVFDLINRLVRVDLGQYKEGTLLRRITRRMTALDIHSIESYYHRVASDELELRALTNDLLIGVTEFFRDAAAWSWLIDNALSDALDRAEADVRMWVVGCSTGQEAYTLGMVVMEMMEQRNDTRPLQIFATDANQSAIQFAMVGSYPKTALNPVPEDLRAKYFRFDGEQFTVRRLLRDRITFAPHNVLTDPPFTRLCLITCRNMLIYLRPEAQRPVLARMHFGLMGGGILFLGSSETVADQKVNYHPRSLKWKIFEARGGSPELSALFTHGIVQNQPTLAPRARRRGPPSSHPFKSALEHYVPPGVAVDPSFDILHLTGEVNQFLMLPEGQASLNLLRMLPPAVSVFVNSAGRRARAGEGPVVIPHVPMGQQVVDIRVMSAPQGTPERGGLLVFFESRPPQDAVLSDMELSQASEERIQRLEDELVMTRENLRTAVEDLEAANEELQATNEELIAANEELQSTNEELQSVNEELFSVNSEYQHKIDELEYLTIDLENLLRSVDVGALFLDAKLQVRRFNDTVQRLLPLRAQDVGRAFSEITINATFPDFVEAVTKVRDDRVPLQRDIVSAAGENWKIDIRPFDEETSREPAGGVIVIFHEVTQLVAREHRMGELAVSELAAGLAGVGVAVVDVKEQLVRLSEAGRKLLGLDEESSFSYSDLHRLLNPEEPADAPTNGGLVTARPGDVLRKYTRTDGSEVLLRTMAQRAFNQTTETEQVIVVFQAVA